MLSKIEYIITLQSHTMHFFDFTFDLFLICQNSITRINQIIIVFKTPHCFVQILFRSQAYNQSQNMMFCRTRHWFGFFFGIGAGAWAMNKYVKHKALYGQSPWGNMKQWHHRYHDKYGPWGENKAQSLKEILKQKTKMTDDEIEHLLRDRREEKILQEKMRFKEWEDKVRREESGERPIERLDRRD